jgi:hypothetical protein
MLILCHVICSSLSIVCSLMPVGAQFMGGILELSISLLGYLSN